MRKNTIDYSVLDKGIREAVEILNRHGFETFESCEGGKGHCYSEPTIRFFGNEFDLIRAFELCKLYKMNIYEAKRVYRKTDVYSEGDKGEPIGLSWDKPFNEMVFIKNKNTGTIFLPN